MKSRVLALCSVLVVGTLVSCDPQKEALKVFTTQGLTVLKPARDYIALGGIFVVSKNGGTPSYLDPYDNMGGSNGTATNFRAVVMKQSSSHSAGLEVAVGTLGGLVSIPAGLKFSNSKNVQLDQIDASGTRYTSQTVEGLIRMGSTSKAIKAQLQQQNRVFVVQELYTSKSLSVKSSDGTSLAAAVKGTPTIPNCASGDNKNATGDKNTTGDKNATGGSSAISVGVCWANSATLSFQSDTAIPFAVRLNEVVADPENALQIKITGFKLPNNALGPGDVAATAFVNPMQSVITDFKRVSH